MLPQLSVEDLCNKAVAAQESIAYIHENTAAEIVDDLLPGMQDLVRRWEELSSYDKGKAVGAVIGEYGVDCLICCGAAKGVKSYRNLRRANAAMTLGVCAESEVALETIVAKSTEQAIHRERVLANANIEIHAGRQGKHIVGHANYGVAERKSVLLHDDPQGIAKKYCGCGIPKNGTVGGSWISGSCRF